MNNIFVSINNTGVHKDSSVLSLSLVSNDKTLYIEFTDTILNNKENSKLLLKEFDNFKKIDDNITLIKDHDNVIIKEIDDFLYECSNNGNDEIKFILEHHTDWFLFINKAFYFNNELPIFKEYYNPNPICLSQLEEFSYFETIINENDNLIIQANAIKKIFEKIYQI